MLQLRAQDIDGSSPLWEVFVTVYEEAFPAAERVPLEQMDHIARMLEGHLTAFLLDERPVGFACWVETEHITYLAYLAAHRAARSLGVGSAMLGHLLRTRPDLPLVADVEQLDPSADNATQRVRRQAFYRRCSLAPTGWEMLADGTVYDIFCSSEAYNPAWEREVIDLAFGTDTDAVIRRAAR